MTAVEDDGSLDRPSNGASEAGANPAPSLVLSAMLTVEDWKIGRQQPRSGKYPVCATRPQPSTACPIVAQFKFRFQPDTLPSPRQATTRKNIV
jgi:hypothetical protein